MVASRSLVLKKLGQIFPDRDRAAEALAALDAYGTEPSQRERDRVQLAILKLCGGDLRVLRHQVESARTDFRDVLAWAEYPGQMKTGASRSNTPAKSIERIEAADRLQYENWLTGGTDPDITVAPIPRNPSR